MMKLMLVVLFALASISVAYTPYKEFDPFNGTYTNTCAATDSSWVTAIQNALHIVGLGPRLITNNQTLLLEYAEDYGHILHRAPKAVFVAQSRPEIAALIQILIALNAFTPHKYQIVTRGGSGNTYGATQTQCDGNHHQILLDTSLLTDIKIVGKTLWAGPGASWLSVVEAAAARNLRPSIVPDYLGITIGGFYSVGGIGADSALNGLGVDQVREIEVVTPTGSMITAHRGSPYFKALRGGLGSFGVMTRVRIALEKSSKLTRVYHILSQNFDPLVKTMKYIINNQMPPVDGLQSFAIANTRANLESSIAPASELNAVNASVNKVLNAPQTWVYYIELSVRVNVGSVAPTKAQVAKWLKTGVDPALVFYTDYNTSAWDNRLKLTVVPFLVSIGAWDLPHPWGTFNFPETSLSIFEQTLQSYDPLLDLGFGLVALYPITVDCVPDDSFFSFPRSTPIGWHLTLGNTVAVPGTLPRMLQNNRNFWNALKANGEASVYPALAIDDFGPADWAHHYGARWEEVKATKKALDPFFIFADQRNFGFASLYD